MRASHLSTDPTRKKASWISRILASDTAWRATGLTYPLAVLATRGEIESLSDYLEQSKGQMAALSDVPLPTDRVLEFGCGIGGNLFAISERISSGLGVDINSGYIRISRRIARRLGVPNLVFERYDGASLSLEPDSFDFVFSLGVFERLSRDKVVEYSRRLADATKPGGVLCLYFLSSRARDSTFTRRLGDEAYTFWDDASLADLGLRIGGGIEVVNVSKWAVADVVTYRKRTD